MNSNGNELEYFPKSMLIKLIIYLLQRVTYSVINLAGKHRFHLPVNSLNTTREVQSLNLTRDLKNTGLCIREIHKKVVCRLWNGDFPFPPFHLLLLLRRHQHRHMTPTSLYFWDYCCAKHLLCFRREKFPSTVPVPTSKAVPRPEPALSACGSSNKQKHCWEDILRTFNLSWYLNLRIAKCWVLIQHQFIKNTKKGNNSLFNI